MPIFNRRRIQQNADQLHSNIKSSLHLEKYHLDYGKMLHRKLLYQQIDTALNITQKLNFSKGGAMWFVFALLSAVFAALTSILAKIGIGGVNSNLATAIRTVVVVFIAWGMAFSPNAQSGISGIGRKAGYF